MKENHETDGVARTLDHCWTVLHLEKERIEKATQGLIIIMTLGNTEIKGMSSAYLNSWMVVVLEEVLLSDRKRSLTNGQRFHVLVLVRKRVCMVVTDDGLA